MTTGLESLAALRRSGRQPKAVDIETDCVISPALGHNYAEANACNGDLVWQVAIGCGETIGRVDLRPVQGLVCTVAGVDADRVAAVAKACVIAGASRVIGSTFHKTRIGRDVCIELIHQTDTEGVMVYAAVPA